uniref:Uncharacterized protein n=1 Tax=Arundo donax TaxID=35708 RepID=A0A0A9BFK8_ARUDO
MGNTCTQANKLHKQ